MAKGGVGYSDMKSILDQVKKLSDKDYQDFVCQAFDTSRPPNIQRSIVKFITKKGSRSAKSQPVGETGVVQEGNLVSCPDLSFTKSAWKSPFIFSSDLIPDNGTLYFDVEKLSLKKDVGEKTHKSVAATVAVVNESRDLVFWAFIFWEPKSICQLFPQMTGLDLTKLCNGITINEVQKFFKMCINGNKVVGLDGRCDLDSLGVEIPPLYEDLHNYYYEMKVNPNNPSKPQKCPYGLQDLALHFFGETGFQCGQHSAIADARMTQKLHKKKEELQKLYPNFEDYPNKIERSTKFKYVFDPKDICKCKKK